MIPCVFYLGLSILIPVSYLGFLYYFDRGGKSRDDPSSIKRRILGVTVSCVISFLATVSVLAPSLEGGVGILEHLGIRWKDILPATLWPLILTAVGFLGPLVHFWMDGVLSDLFLPSSTNDLRWIRNCIAAPVSEEVAFRLCTASLLRGCWSETVVVGVAPIFFSLAHFHHLVDLRRRGLSLRSALLSTSFQAAYTYAFGAYATYIYLRTNHILPPILCHMFGNILGFPPIQELFQEHDQRRKWILLSLYAFGVVIWWFFLFRVPNL